MPRLYGWCSNTSQPSSNRKKYDILHRSDDKQNNILSTDEFWTFLPQAFNYCVTRHNSFTIPPFHPSLLFVDFGVAHLFHIYGPHFITRCNSLQKCLRLGFEYIVLREFLLNLVESKYPAFFYKSQSSYECIANSCFGWLKFSYNLTNRYVSISFNRGP